jgi:hypothetical protein
MPAYAQALGHGPDAFERNEAPRHGGDQPAFRLVASRDAAWADVLFVAVDAQH